jgi:hypothetical protein
LGEEVEDELEHARVQLRSGLDCEERRQDPDRRDGYFGCVDREVTYSPAGRRDKVSLKDGDAGWTQLSDDGLFPIGPSPFDENLLDEPDLAAEEALRVERGSGSPVVVAESRVVG